MSMFSESLRAFLKPVTPYLDDPEVSEILINGPEEVWIEKRGKLSRTDARFSEEGLLAAARNMAQYVGRPLTEERPRLDARLPDGSRIHVVLPPVARRGTTVSIRKFFPERLTVSQLIAFGSITPALGRLLQALVGLRINMVVAGGTGSGKTSLLNVLSSMIAPDERILTIEDSAELQLQQPHLVSFESRPADRLGKGEVNIGDLLHSALRLRPDRIIVGEVRGGECFYLLQAMNTGHGGSLTTAHANTPVDTLRRLESLCLLSGVELPLRAVRAQVASAVHVVICCERLGDGTRKVTSVTEVLSLDEKGEYRAQDLFVFTQTGRGPQGEVIGHHAPTGVLPTFLAKLHAAGYGDLDASFFDPAAQGLAPPPGFLADLGQHTRWARDVRTGLSAITALAGGQAAGLAQDGGAISLSGEAAAPEAVPAPAPLPGTAAGATPAWLTALAGNLGVSVASLAGATATGAAVSAAPAARLAAAAPTLAVSMPSVLPPSIPAAHSAAISSPIAATLPAPIPPTLPALPAFPEATAAPVVTPSGLAPLSAGKARAPGAVRSTTLPGPPPKRPASNPAPAQPAPAAAARPSAESSIELDPELQAEVEAALPYESTLITRNPLLEQQRRAGGKSFDDETTNPGARHPGRR